MGRKLFGIDIAKTVNHAISSAGGLNDVTLTRIELGPRSTTDPTAGRPERTQAARGQGMLEDYRDSQIDGTKVQRGDRMVYVLAESLSPKLTPRPNDRITVTTENGEEGGRIVEGGVKTDPAGAGHICQVRQF